MTKNRILSIFLPQLGCPNKCIFCNQQAVTGIESIPSLDEIERQIVSFLSTGTDTNLSTIEIAFYGGNFTGLDWSYQQKLLTIVQKVIRETGNQVGIRISTRPDYVNKTVLARLKEHGVSTIELGLQSLSNEVLAASGRAYTAEAALKACREVLESGFQLGVHLMLGLPKDTRETALNSLDKTLALHPHFIRLHPTLVLKNTGLAQNYTAGEYQPLSLAEAIDWCKELYLHCERVNVPVVRLGLQPSPELCKPGTVIAGPFHSAFGELVKAALAYDRMNMKLTELKETHQEKNRITFYVPARELSIYRGQHNQNLTKLKQAWKLDNISITQIDTGLEKARLAHGYQRETASFNLR
jgi:histone acetyltransferase (RNA polymerase elongator complex component)